MKQAAVAVLLLILPLTSLAALLNASIDKRAIALGQQLNLMLSSERIDQSLEEIDLRPLQGDFAVFGRAYLSSTDRRGGRDVRMQSLELRLVALRSGRLVIPPLQIGAARSRPFVIEVSAGSSEFPNVIVKTGYAAKLYQRSETLLFLDLYDDSTLQWQAPKVRVSGILLRPLPASSRVEQLGDERYRVTRFAWGAMPLQGGSAVVDFGLIEAIHFGERVAFRAPAAVGDVEAVPTYLPLDVHIGRLELLKQSVPENLQVGRPAYWIVEIGGSGLSANGLRKSIRLTGNSALHFYAPQISVVDQDNGNQLARIVQPLKPLHEGSAAIPGLRIAYYDPHRAEIAALETAIQRRTVFDPVREQFRMRAATVSLVLAALAVAWMMRRRLDLMWRRVKTKMALRGATNASEFLHVIYGLDRAAIDLSVIEAIVYGHGDAADFDKLRAQYLAQNARATRAQRGRQKSAAERILVRA